MKHNFLMLILTAMLLGMIVSTAIGQNGACCYLDGSEMQCMITDDEDYCTWTLFGSFHTGATCDDIDPENGIADICEYVPVEGACCYDDGSGMQCMITDDEDYCTWTLFGSFNPGATCEDVDPENGIADICESGSQEGACCYDDGSGMQCMITDDEDYCAWTLFGSFNAGATCEDMYPENGIADICEYVPVEGACCYYEGEDLMCMITGDEEYCQDTLNGDFHSGATCEDIDPENGIADICDPAASNGACCYDDGSSMQCEITDDIMYCTETLGGFFRLGATCDDIDPQNGVADICDDEAPGACCFYDGTFCMIFDYENDCVYSGGTWMGVGSVCGEYDEETGWSGCSVTTTYEYLPGDANMAAGSWPPNVIGADVTYLVNYFRAIAAPCLVGGFYNSADANGDCSVIGADVTYLVQYFRGANELHFCPDYEPTWQSSGDLPAEAPDSWPNCE